MSRSSKARRINRMLDGATKAAIAEVAPALLKQAKQIQTTMQQLAEPSRDTGALIDSIAVTPPGSASPPYSQPGGSRVAQPNEVLVTAGNTDVRYAHLVEYGTAKAPAQPFFWPAFRLERKRAAAAIKRAIAKAVRTGANSGV